MKKIRYIPYGYAIKNGKIVIVNDEAEIIKKIFELYINGASLKDIANKLTSQNVQYTEKTTKWDKARISRIMENTKYLGMGEYAPIIGADIYRKAIERKSSKQRNVTSELYQSVKHITHRVRCGKCGGKMMRKIFVNNTIKECWICQNEECGMRVRLSDEHLLRKLNAIINRIIANNKLLIPKQPHRIDEASSDIQNMINEINVALSRQNSDEDYILQRIRAIAQERYKNSDVDKQLETKSILNKVQSMCIQDEFNSNGFNELVEYVVLNEDGKVLVHTKTNTNIEERNDYD